MNITDSFGGRNSVYPPIEGVTFFPFIYMVPQYRPDDVLMLGYAGGTAAGLIRLFYGYGIPITAVDIQGSEDYYNVNFVKGDARFFIKEATHKWDSVIVDVYEDGDDEPCSFVTNPSFIHDLKRIGKYLIIHAKEGTDMSNYGKPLKVLELNRSRFYYYMVERIARMPIR
jgi:hypothetical protein